MTVMDFINNNASAVFALGGVVFSVLVTFVLQTLKSIVEQKLRRKELRNKTYNKILSSSYKITGFDGYNSVIKEAGYSFDYEQYAQTMRPALYENFDLLPFSIKQQIFKIDHVIESGPFGDYTAMEEHTNDVVAVVNRLIEMIKVKCGYHDKLLND